MPKKRVISNNGITVKSSSLLISGRSTYFSLIFPKNILWKAHKKYAAFSKIPIVEAITMPSSAVFIAWPKIKILSFW